MSSIREDSATDASGELKILQLNTQVASYLWQEINVLFQCRNHHGDGIIHLASQ